MKKITSNIIRVKAFVNKKGVTVKAHTRRKVNLGIGNEHLSKKKADKLTKDFYAKEGKKLTHQRRGYSLHHLPASQLRAMQKMSKKKY